MSRHSEAYSELTRQRAPHPITNQPVFEILSLTGLDAAINSIAKSHQWHGTKNAGNWNTQQANKYGTEHASDRPCSSCNYPSANPPDELEDQRLQRLIRNISRTVFIDHIDSQRYDRSQKA